MKRAHPRDPGGTQPKATPSKFTPPKQEPQKWSFNATTTDDVLNDFGSGEVPGQVAGLVSRNHGICIGH